MPLPYYNNNTTLTTGNGIIYTSTSNICTSPSFLQNGSSIDSIEIDKSLIEYIDLLYQLIGVDMNYDKFKSLSTSEKQSFIRDIKIKKLLDNAIPENQ